MNTFFPALFKKDEYSLLSFTKISLFLHIEKKLRMSAEINYKPLDDTEKPVPKPYPLEDEGYSMPMAAEGEIVLYGFPVSDIIIEIRGVKVILDRDLARLYDVETKVLNQAVKRNIRRFPDDFRFQLTNEEVTEVVTNCDHLKMLKYSPNLPYAFTKKGVAMMPALLQSDRAVEISVQIIEAFVALDDIARGSLHLYKRIEAIEHRQLASENDMHEVKNRLSLVMQKMEQKHSHPTQGIFFDGQVFDAYTFVCDLVRSARQRIVLIDNYCDDTTLKILDNRADGVFCTIYTAVSDRLAKALAKHNAQYPAIEVTAFDRSHDRYLCIDDRVYHVGASLKDLGKRWFSFSLLGDDTTARLLSRLSATNRE